jgi:hypothetical protein
MSKLIASTYRIISNTQGRSIVEFTALNAWWWALPQSASFGQQQRPLLDLLLISRHLLWETPFQIASRLSLVYLGC